MALVAHDPDDAEAGPGADRTGEVREGGGIAQRRTPGADAYPAAEQVERGVEFEADADLVRAGAVPGGLDQLQLGGVVDHDGDGGGQFGVARELGEPGAVGGGVGQQHVLEPRPGQPDRLGEGVRHDPGETGPGQDPFEERAAADGLAGDADRLAAGPADEIVGVGVERGEIDDGQGRVEMRGGPVVPGPVSTGGKIHGGSLPDASTGG